MAGDLVERLEALPSSELWRFGAAGEGAVERFEEAVGLRFPDDFRAAMRFSNGFSLVGRPSPMTVFDMERLVPHNMDERFEEDLPGMFVIGTDGGGAVYFYDPEGALGAGRWALHIARLSDLGFDDARLVAASLTEAVEAVLAGERFLERPRRGGGGPARAET